jgi:hypothetical protein
MSDGSSFSALDSRASGFRPFEKQRWALLLFCILAAAVAAPVQAQCAAEMPFVACPTATQAAQLLTGNSQYLPVSNALFEGACANADGQMGIVTSFTAGCHYLSSLMPQGNKQQKLQWHRNAKRHISCAEALWGST